MATYFPGVTNQRDVLLTPYLGDQKFTSYSEAPLHPGNVMMYLNQPSSGSYSDILSGSSLSPQNCYGSAGGRNEMMFIPPTGGRVSMQAIDGQFNAVTGEPLGNSVNGDSQVVARTQLGVPDGEQNIQCQGLSLSLGTQIPSSVSVASFGSQYPNACPSSFFNTSLPLSRNVAISGSSGGNHDNTRTETFCNPHSTVSPKEMLSDRYPYEQSSFTSSILNSKYLKAAQQLLDEMVNVWRALKQRGSIKHQNNQGIGLDGSKETDGRSNSQSAHKSSDPGDLTNNSSCELSPAELQDLQNKKTRLLSMLDEVNLLAS
jgi:hypothetical protein